MSIICSIYCINICSKPCLSCGVGVSADTEAGAEAWTGVEAEACVVADVESNVDVEAGAEIDAEVAALRLAVKWLSQTVKLVLEQVPIVRLERLTLCTPYLTTPSQAGGIMAR